jgi:amino acid transporter
MADSIGLSISGNLRREARIVGLLFASTTSMIGSGWLFGAYHASRIAGPLSVWSWVAGGVIIMLIALCFAELAALFPRSGALVHMSHASHGEGLGRIWGWMLFLAYVPVPAVEAEAIVTYANNYLPYFIKPGSAGLLTESGFAVCVLLLGVLALLNLLAVRVLLNFNSTVTWWKIAVPVLTVIVLIVASSHWDVWAADPNSYHFSDIFTALPAAGIVFSYLGFRTAIDLGGESSNPSRHIPLAVIGSVLLSAVVYILLQVAFLMALRPSDLARGWAHLSFAGQAGPFAGLAATLGIGWMATLLYVDAYISPGGTGLMYLTGGSRILFAIGEMEAGPRWLTSLNAAGAPLLAVLIMWIVGILFLLPFPAWQLMVNYITSITVLTYGLGPIVLLVLRRNQPTLQRPFPAVESGTSRADCIHLQQLDHLLDRLQDELLPVRAGCSELRPLRGALPFHRQKTGGRLRLALHRLATALVRRHVGTLRAQRHRWRPCRAELLAWCRHGCRLESRRYRACHALGAARGGDGRDHVEYRVRVTFASHCCVGSVLVMRPAFLVSGARPA